MELTVHVICRPSQMAGLALAGLNVDVAEDSAAAALMIRQLTADPKVGLVFVDSNLHDGLSRELRARLDTQGRPVITPFPSPVWDEREAAEDYVLEILRQAIGYRVRPR